MEQTLIEPSILFTGWIRARGQRGYSHVIILPNVVTARVTETP